MGNEILQAIPTLEKDIPADQFLVQDFWIPLAWCCAILIPLASVAAIWFYRRRKGIITGIAPFQEALNSLVELDAEVPPMRECSLRLSMILRSYLAGETQDPALYETHEEFSQRMDSLSHVPVNCQLETRDLLEHLAEFKYAGATEQNPAQARALIEQTRNLIARIHNAREQEQNKEVSA